MALRSNSKQAVENIRQYIRDGYNPEGYELQDAGQLLTWLIYRELKKGERKA